jgi:hypothetical protein
MKLGFKKNLILKDKIKKIYKKQSQKILELFGQTYCLNHEIEIT